MLFVSIVEYYTSSIDCSFFFFSRKASASAVGSKLNYEQGEVEINLQIAWNEYGNHARAAQYLDDVLLGYDGEASPCIQGVDVVWSTNKSAHAYNLLASSDNVHFHPLIAHQNRNASMDNIKQGCRSPMGSGSCIDHHDFSNHPYRAKYVRLQLLQPSRPLKYSTTQQNINAMRYEIREIRILGAVCPHDFQSGSTTSAVTFDVGEKSQTTNVIPQLQLPMSSSKSAGESFASPFDTVLTVGKPSIASNYSNSLIVGEFERPYFCLET